MRDVKGFTLIELMVMLSIVLILVAIAIPNYSSSIARSEQSEAKSSLAEIYVKMMGFNPLSVNNGTVLDGFENATLENIGFNPPDNPHYSYSLDSLETDEFKARAEGIAGRVIGDVWIVSEVQKVPFDVNPNRFDG